MAFKLAKNSLFAILMRAPWWYSTFIGLSLIAIGGIVASGQYVILGIFSSLPFFGIAGSAAYRQFQQPSQKRILEVAQQARLMPALQISEKIASRYKDARYESDVFKGNAADLELTRGHRKLLLSSRRFKAANTGIEPLKQLVAAGEKVEATGYLYVTLGDISAAARDYAKQNEIEFIQADRLAAFFDGKVNLD